MAHIEVMLMDDVAKLGKAGDIVKVAPGYARNALIPQGLAAFATEAALIELDGRLISDLPIENGAVSVTLPPFRIATVRFA